METLKRYLCHIFVLTAEGLVKNVIGITRNLLKKTTKLYVNYL